MDGVAIFIVYDEADDRAKLEACELGPVGLVIRLAQRDFITGPDVWETEGRGV